MNETREALRLARARSWSEDIELCHIIADDITGQTYCGECGEPEHSTCPTPWNGEAMCLDCGNPMCPRCVQLSYLDDQLA